MTNFISMAETGAPVDAEAVFGKIEELKNSLKTNLVELAKCLLVVRERLLFRQKGYATFGEYVKAEFEFGAAWGRRLVSLGLALTREMITEEQVESLGVDKAARIAQSCLPRQKGRPRKTVTATVFDTDIPKNKEDSDLAQIMEQAEGMDRRELSALLAKKEPLYPVTLRLTARGKGLWELAIQRVTDMGGQDIYNQPSVEEAAPKAISQSSAIEKILRFFLKDTPGGVPTELED